MSEKTVSKDNERTRVIANKGRVLLATDHDLCRQSSVQFQIASTLSRADSRVAKMLGVHLPNQDLKQETWRNYMTREICRFPILFCSVRESKAVQRAVSVKAALSVR